MNIHKHPVASALAAVLLIGASLSLSPQKISATEAGPNGSNVGFDFSWNDSVNPS